MMTRIFRLLGLFLTLFMAVSFQANSHEVRPAYYEITQNSDNTIDVLFKQPSAGSLTISLEPQITGDLLKSPPSFTDAGLGFQTRTWKHIKLSATGLNGLKVGVKGLDRSITDALLVIKYADGHVRQEILKPESPEVSLDVRGDGLPVLTYLKFGIEHILTGYDHLTFVLGLVLLVRGIGTLLKTITAFTVAHSITLAITALGVVHVSPAKIEALVALSIVFVAVELTNQYRGHNSLTQKWPWLIAFCFGLLHGSAFVGALAEIGLPQNNIPAALLLFNIGVEIGQLMFVSVVLAIIYLLLKLNVQKYRFLQALPAYAIGTCAVFWFFERFHAAVL